jgi:hypothetical protein
MPDIKHSNDVTVHGYPKCIPFDEFDKRILGRARYELAEDNSRLRDLLCRIREAIGDGTIDIPEVEKAVCDEIDEVLS